jgi:pimeloyl-ACP methyl ester carboxylesterase
MFSVILLSIVLGVLLLGWGYRLARQWKDAQALRIDTPNGLDEGFFAEIDGLAQWVRIRGEDKGAPVLFFVNGGPGVSYLPFASILREWERECTVVYWDQPGSGKTLAKSGKQRNRGLSIDRLASDGIAVAELVANRLGREKVILLCHSWGTVLGVGMAHRRPDLFSAYVGTGQVVDMAQNEAESYRLLLERLNSTGKSPGRLTPPPYEDMKTWMVKQRMLIMNTPPPSGGREMPDIMTAPLFAAGYSLRDACFWFSGMGFSAKELFAEMMAYDARRVTTRLDVPVLMIQGEIDMQSPTSVARAYFDEIEAPSKEFIVIPGEGHSAIMTMPDIFLSKFRECRPSS